MLGTVPRCSVLGSWDADTKGFLRKILFKSVSGKGACAGRGTGAGRAEGEDRCDASQSQSQRRPGCPGACVGVKGSEREEADGVQASLVGVSLLRSQTLQRRSQSFNLA